eukprot:CAMPEP_0197863798 /NCGR_PEP_ID=MMETSP1438-20131217/41537_1 /TAXON_ID=1461541 /ORGANISM="Pterosperma sp., Strain CCMP1384" /LENGTH=146 /DNA_ID=CAMNT_0043481829 /DNA_START=107 /DNA_END=548 /DNA_ORIENTATION=-
MPKIRTGRTKYPEGWELIEPTLKALDTKMRDAEGESHEGKRKCESLWPIFRLAHQRSRYIYDLYYRRKKISRELYEFCLNEGWADKNLIAKWKKPGYNASVACSAFNPATITTGRPASAGCPSRVWSLGRLWNASIVGAVDVAVET